MAKYNLHAHTPYSNNGGHAFGEIEFVIKKAIEQGYETWGFSEHVPFTNISGTKRTTQESAEKYIREVNFYKEKYKGKIEILCGFEVETFEEEFLTYKAYLKNPGVDFLLVGNHFVPLEYGKLMKFEGESGWDSAFQAKKYVDTLINFFENIDCKYLAHADRGFPVESKWDGAVLAEANRLIDYCIKNKISLAAGVPSFLDYKSKGYKGDSTFKISFWKEVAKYNDAIVVVEVDYHNPNHLCQATRESLIEELETIGINVINK